MSLFLLLVPQLKFCIVVVLYIVVGLEVETKSVSESKTEPESKTVPESRTEPEAVPGDSAEDRVGDRVGYRAYCAHILKHLLTDNFWSVA